LQESFGLNRGLIVAGLYLEQNMIIPITYLYLPQLKLRLRMRGARRKALRKPSVETFGWRRAGSLRVPQLPHVPRLPFAMPRIHVTP
jgi:hypothetical protein